MPDEKPAITKGAKARLQDVCTAAFTIALVGLLFLGSLSATGEIMKNAGPRPSAASVWKSSRKYMESLVRRNSPDMEHHSSGLNPEAGVCDLTVEEAERIWNEEEKQGYKLTWPKQMDIVRRCMPQLYRMFLSGTQWELGKLGYGTGPFDGVLDERTQRAIKAYQKNSGLPVTGLMDEHMLDQLSVDSNLVDRVTPSLPDKSFSARPWSSYVEVSGTWIMENEESGNPVQTSRVTCYKAWNACLESTASIVPGTSADLDLDHEFLEVERWDDHEIVTKPRDFGCVRYTMRISRSRSSATKLRTTLRTAGICGAVDTKDFRIRMGDGSEVTEKIDEQHRMDIERLVQADWNGMKGAFDMKEWPGPKSKK